MRKRMVVITTAYQAISALGGTRNVAAMFEPELGYRVVHNWISRELPPDTYHVLAPALMRAGLAFSPLLFAQKLPAKSARQRSRTRKTDQSLSI